MTLRYDKKTDTLTIEVGPEYEDYYESFTYKAGDFGATVDEVDNFIRLTVQNATRFVTRALQAGVTVEGAPEVPPLKDEMICMTPTPA